MWPVVVTQLVGVTDVAQRETSPVEAGPAPPGPQAVRSLTKHAVPLLENRARDVPLKRLHEVPGVDPGPAEDQ